MDEPLWFGHYDTEPLTCQAPIPELVSLVAATVNDFASLWPDIAVVEIEPAIAVASIPGWQRDLASFLAGLERMTGKPVRTLQLDVDWHNPAALAMVSAFDLFARQTNRSIGLIYNGTDKDASATAWLATAAQAMEDVEGRKAIRPTQAFFISWNTHPARNLPETDPTTLTWLINRHDRAPSHIEVHPNGEELVLCVSGSVVLTQELESGVHEAVKGNTLSLTVSNIVFASKCLKRDQRRFS